MQRKRFSWRTNKPASTPSLALTQNAAGIVDVTSDPVAFVSGFLNVSLWDIQQRILWSVANHQRTAVKACHASGKSFVAACAVLWWLIRYHDGMVVTTAPTWTQVEKVLWGEIHRVMRGGRLLWPDASQTQIKLGPKNFAMGLSTNEGVRFQGFHGDHILIVMDEAPGVAPDIWEAIEGIRAGGNVSVLALGNPTVSSGPFYDAFGEQRSSWQTFTISAFDTPNLRGLDLQMLLGLSEDDLRVVDRGYLTTRAWVREKFDEWGEQSPLWASRVLGDFPAQADNALISLTWLEAAERTIPLQSRNMRTAGVDVAGPGEDETVLVVRHGPNVERMHCWSMSDPRGALVHALGDRQQYERVNVDACGIGYYLGKHLQDLGYSVTMVNVGEAAGASQKYGNKKAAYYWALREYFKAGEIGGIKDRKLVAQLAGILYKHDPRGRVVIESKEDARKRGVKSPDRAEALMLAFAPLVEQAPQTSDWAEVGARENPWRM